MASSTSISLIKEPDCSIRKNPRRGRLLYTFGALILTIFYKACLKTHICNKPTGKTTKRVYTIINQSLPLIRSIQNQWLAILSFIDDHIIVFEDLIETLIPPFAHVFNKLDELIRVSESLPRKFDDFIDKLPMVMHQAPFIGWMFNVTKEEKEIVIDITCNYNNIQSQNSVNVEESKNLAESDCLKGEEHALVESTTIMETSMDSCYFEGSKTDNKCSYKEILEKGREENIDDKKKGGKIMEGNNENIVQSDDHFLELFETGWHKSPRQK